MKIAVLVPVYNDYECLTQLLTDSMDCGLSELDATLFVVDDGSAVIHEDFPWLKPSAFTEIVLIRLRRNVGHQRALAIGLCQVADQKEFTHVVTMDSDGEDRVQDVRLLIEKLALPTANIAVARRTDRNESARFKFFYGYFKTLFRILTGQEMDFGNFVAMDRSSLARLTSMNELWNHYPAAIMRSKVPISRINLPRGKRYSGKSQMNFTSLVNHGLGAISAFIDTVLIRILVIASALVMGTLLIAFAVLAVRLITQTEFDTWVYTSILLILIALVQAMAVVVVVVFLNLTGRSNPARLPFEFARSYVLGTRIFPSQDMGSVTDG